MYTNIAKIKAGELLWVDMNEGTSGGFKGYFEVTGEDVYGTLKFEAGVHRVQQSTTNRNSGSCAHFSSNRYGITRSRNLMFKLI
jgi:peptide chain release factor 1